MTRPEILSHDEAIELLPWLVNESLEAGMREAVSAHASTCIICRRELGELRVLHDSIHQASLDTATPPVDMRRINSRIDAHLERERRGARLLTTLREFFRSPLRIGFAAQSLVLVVLAALWLQPQDAPFQTLTTSESLPDGHYVRVVFDPTLDEKAISGLLGEYGLSVANGPSARGVYTLKFMAGAGDSERHRAATELRSDARVLFAEAVIAGDGS